MIFSFGCISGLSFSGLSVFICVPLMIVSLSFLLLFLFYSKNKNYLHFFSIGSLFSFGQLLVGLYWISFSFEYVFTNGIYFGFISILFLTFILSIFYGLSCIIILYIHNIWQLNIFGFAMIFSIFLSLSEYLRGNVFGGFPWNIIGYIWSYSDIMMQSLSIIGVYGLGLLTFLAATSIALIFHKIRYGFYAFLPIILCALYGEIRLNLQNTDYNDYLQIRIVQPSISQDLKWDQKLRNQHLEKLISLSLKDNGKNKPKIILWPESSLPYNSSFLEKNIEIINWLDYDQILIAGITRTEFNNNQLKKMYNSALITDKLFNNIYYDKIKLVPFGEYIPLKNFFNFNKITNGPIDFSSGKNSNIVKLIDTKYNIGILICYEIIFSGNVIQGERPDFLVNITNDAWYGNTYGPLQHLSAARARAIEEGMPIIRSANTGVSAVIDEYGQYLDRLELGESGILDINLPIKKKNTVFSFVGNYLYLISLIFMLMLTRFAFISKKLK
ncbi:MAG: Apolipoprotein N-acyltransferase [Alphaproteobacteria bacterium MarineAlpha9_Bin3]|nr:MAG: Apolipoprotein N-acyltransferase [Alphaproteobacteria bacterium MarineAlpha9_Bin3]